MNETMKLLGRTYDSRKGMCEHFGISTVTASRWDKRGVLPVPIRIGRTAYYDREYIETKLAEGAAAGDLGPTVYVNRDEDTAVPMGAMTDGE